MSEKEVWKFLESQTKIYAGFPMWDGYPHVSPVWFCVENGKIYLRTHDYKTKTRLARTREGLLRRRRRLPLQRAPGRHSLGEVTGNNRHEADRAHQRIIDKKYERQQWKPSEMPGGWVEERRKEKRAFIEVDARADRLRGITGRSSPFCQTSSSTPSRALRVPGGVEEVGGEPVEERDELGVDLLGLRQARRPSSRPSCRPTGLGGGWPRARSHPGRMKFVRRGSFACWSSIIASSLSVSFFPILGSPVRPTAVWSLRRQVCPGDEEPPLDPLQLLRDLLSARSRRPRPRCSC